MNQELSDKQRLSLYGQARLLAMITVFYNIVEGVVSVFFGFEDETISLFGFGLDSFVEVISGIGVWHLIHRLEGHAESDPDQFEKTALRITGTAFYILTSGLVFTAGYNLYIGHKPITTVWGIIIASISLLTMWLLIHYKVKVGNSLRSQAILADAECTRACFYLSITLLLASLGYELTGIGGIDSIGAAIIAVFAFREGRESFGKAQGLACGCTPTWCGSEQPPPETDT